jgi:hypothetical protein
MATKATALAQIDISFGMSLLFFFLCNAHSGENRKGQRHYKRHIRDGRIDVGVLPLSPLVYK